MRPRAVFHALLFTATLGAGAEVHDGAKQRLKLAVVQMAQAPTLAGNRDRIIAGIADAARRDARVVVFPEAALMGQGSDDLAAIDDAVAAIRRATRDHGTYVMFGATTHTPAQKKDTNWMLVVGPDGRDLLRYDKLYDQPKGPMPGVFEIDGIPCGAIICADRWLRGIEEIPIQQGAKISFELSCNSAVDVTIAAAQVTGDVSAMEAKIREARDRKADLIVFPARAVAETALPRLQAAARASTITVVFGAEHRVDGRTWNSAFALGPDGGLLTRYDQLSATKPLEPGTDATAMWFQVKGVPAVVTIGRDGLWTELSELAAAAGAQIHVHLEHDRSSGQAAMLRQQVWANLASYQTFTATVNVVESMIWHDLRGLEERRAPIGYQQPESGAVEVYSQYSANLVARAKSADELLFVTRRVNATNLYHTRTVARKNPQMGAWYRLGAAGIQPK